MLQSPETRLKTVVKNLQTMLTNRHYSLQDQIHVPDNVELLKDYSSLSQTINDEQGNPIKILFYNHPSLQAKIGVSPIRKILDTLQAEEVMHCLIVVNTGLSPKTMEEISQSPVCVECFTENQLMFDLVSHKLIPPHRRLSDAEKKKIHKKYGEKLPILQRSDPVCRYYDFQVNDVIEITRSGFRTTFLYKHYRTVQ